MSGWALALLLGVVLGAILAELVRAWWRAGNVASRPLEQFTSEDLMRMEALERALGTDLNRLRSVLARVHRMRRTAAVDTVQPP